ncbi:MAG: hypothetical protein H6Q31_2030, partial [Bacteroidetes bacterium]|nr:hypothetical protein [Bacteroidota bacterium]
RSEESQDFAGVDIKRDVVHRFLLTVDLGEIPY